MAGFKPCYVLPLLFGLWAQVGVCGCAGLSSIQQVPGSVPASGSCHSPTHPLLPGPGLGLCVRARIHMELGCDKLVSHTPTGVGDSCDTQLRWGETGRRCRCINNACPYRHWSPLICTSPLSAFLLNLGCLSLLSALVSASLSLCLSFCLSHHPLPLLRPLSLLHASPASSPPHCGELAFASPSLTLTADTWVSLSPLDPPAHTSGISKGTLFTGQGYKRRPGDRALSPPRQPHGSWGLRQQSRTLGEQKGREGPSPGSQGREASGWH